MHIREAVRADVPAIVALLADDMLGRQREDLRDPLPPAYWAAFDAIAADANHLLVVGEVDGEVVATLDLVLLASLSHRGGWRAQIEAVRVAAAHRGGGHGRAMVLWAVDEARRRGCRMVQLTTDKRRHDAHRFYAALGFVASHEGMKLRL